MLNPNWFESTRLVVGIDPTSLAEIVLCFLSIPAVSGQILLASQEGKAVGKQRFHNGALSATQ